MSFFSAYGAGITILVAGAVIVLAHRRHQWRRGECEKCGLPRERASKLCRAVEVTVEVER